MLKQLFLLNKANIKLPTKYYGKLNQNIHQLILHLDAALYECPIASPRIVIMSLFRAEAYKVKLINIIYFSFSKFLFYVSLPLSALYYTNSDHFKIRISESVL